MHECEGRDAYWNVPVKVKKEKKVKIPIKDSVSVKKIGRGVGRGFEKPKIKFNAITAYGYNNIVLGIITIMFFIGNLFPASFQYLALFPNKFIEMPWQLITSMFFHVEFGHFLVNAIVLLFFGTELERRVGGKNYIKIFLLSGLAGNIGYLAFSLMSGSYAGALGSSGAIYGIMGTLAIIAPEIRVLFFFFIPMSIRVALVIFALYDLLMLPLSSISGVAHIAHLSGLLVGLYYGDKFKAYRNRWRW